MSMQSLFQRISSGFTRSCQKLVVLASAAVPGLALADLPELEEPTQGSDGIRSQAQGYLYDFGVLGGLIICVVAFLFVAMSAISSFREAQARGEWSKFGITFVAGVILVLAVIWLATEAAPILAQ
ncbi:TIGR03745 family integrating conjugative element membrane protein [Kushneria indalinina]|uniref:Integrating conjugative element membrane protein (TIGR03745 family) n=1 Tax=Kushneria indalinina DSM 14324 TaxID=1122140 RepID=A0A3D9DRL9_9GAMM|nr:TIGR03745 family integrating conjugative element membrane protein [Kushneria indalinina]REC93360.1 integrating conjugative element membrane protein (TIGR03745 family) [Kushneria indalinina DSM 14324]